MKMTACQHNLTKLAAALCASMMASSPAFAVEIDTGSEDWTVRWDNSFRYNLQTRVEERDSRIGGSHTSDEGDYKFDRGDITSNRLDILSELEVGWRNTHGFRVSASGWFDQAYNDDDVEQNPALKAQGYQSSYNNGNYSSTTERFYRGPSGEILDAFVYGNFDLAGMALSAKAGQHVVYWGNSIFTQTGISNSQAPIDGRKGAATPGSETRELFLPLNQISASLQVTDSFSVAAQYFLDWDHVRSPEGGTFLGPADLTLDGPDRLHAAPFPFPQAFLTRGDAVEPDDKSGDWGVNAKYNFIDWNATTVGLYYREYAEKNGLWLLLNPQNPGEYRAVFPDDVKLYGLSVDATVGVFAVGAEVAYRKNTGLNSVGFAPSAEGARGETYHVVLNTIYGLKQNAIWDSGTLLAELSYDHLIDVTKNEQFFNGEDTANCQNGKFSGCATDDAIGLGVRFAPTWSQIFPGVDLTVPFTYQVGLKGNTADFGGTSQGAATYSVGAEFSIRNQWTVGLTYADSSAKINRAANGSYYGNGNWQTTDRGRVGLTVKTSF
ncbi:Anaerobic dehydrogenases, typically selenocysteine-containing [Pseudomonas sp. 9AZ]|uniref:DUF1302 domain-containing protein n=1 Tax=Pseudomonas sp. 9AZ TaxID=2653168 RepID=UPI0012EF766F|nr:DUF1302 domain-containing protein [Pseudomonas sp. 9AZ]VXD05220.1 Anaerobic dehydrogenases, typically selenocysteine-containing [Pseudomonas sp. 9AZ]